MNTNTELDKQLEKLLGDIIDFPAFTLSDRKKQIAEAVQALITLFQKREREAVGKALAHIDKIQSSEYKFETLRNRSK